VIARLEGKLIKLNNDSALVQVGPIGYEVMLPGYAVAALADKIGSEIALCTMEYYEGTPGGSSFVPRIIGFLNEAEKDFFTKFVSVKGIGVKKGLRSLGIPIATIAAAIENGDDKMLLSLDGVGKRMAQQIIAELRGKLESFAAGAELPGREQISFKPFQAEALEILIAWGERRSEAMELIELASAEQLVPLVYRLKQGVEV
jgi:Holliday junction DNA helicase RuvA